MVEAETRELHHLLARRITAIGAGVHCSALTSGISVDLAKGMTNALRCVSDLSRHITQLHVWRCVILDMLDMRRSFIPERNSDHQ